MNTPVVGGGPPGTQPPTAPNSLSASAVSSSQINLSWPAATDNVGVAGYRVERCQGAGCSNYAEIATTTTQTTYDNTGLAAATSYSYRVRAADARGNLGPYSPVATASTSADPGQAAADGAHEPDGRPRSAPPRSASPGPPPPTTSASPATGSSAARTRAARTTPRSRQPRRRPPTTTPGSQRPPTTPTGCARSTRR